MVVVFVLAGVAVLGAVVVLAMGRGGELAEARPDHPPLPFAEDGRPVSGDDVAYLRLPRTFWGYQPQLTDEVLQRLASALTERDERVAALERRLHDLGCGPDATGPPRVGALHGLEGRPLEGHALEAHGPDERAVHGAASPREADEPAGGGSPPRDRP